MILFLTTIIRNQIIRSINILYLDYFMRKVLGIGVDVLNIKRIEQISDIDKFANKILHHSEITDTYVNLQNHQLKVRYLAKRFCIKEAISKAFGTGISSFLSFKDIIISHTHRGKPDAKLDNNFITSNKYNEIIKLNDFDDNKIHNIIIHISISDDGDICIGYCTIEVITK
jgi:holo-[acyl-carrier protein] synthase